MMPEVDGFDVLQILKEDEETRDIPVLILTSSNRSVDMEKATIGGVAEPAGTVRTWLCFPSTC